MTSTTQLRCPYCHTGLDNPDAEESCQICHTPHHADCLAEYGGCAVLGCAGAPADVPAAAGPPDLQPVPIAGFGHTNYPPPSGYSPQPSVPTPPAPTYGGWSPATHADPGVGYGGWNTPAAATPDAAAVTPLPVPQQVPAANPAAAALAAHPIGVAGWYDLPGRGLTYGVPWLFELPPPAAPSGPEVAV